MLDEFGSIMAALMQWDSADTQEPALRDVEEGEVERESNKNVGRFQSAFEATTLRSHATLFDLEQAEHYLIVEARAVQSMIKMSRRAVSSALSAASAELLSTSAPLLSNGVANDSITTTLENPSSPSLLLSSAAPPSEENSNANNAYLQLRYRQERTVHCLQRIESFWFEEMFDASDRELDDMLQEVLAGLAKRNPFGFPREIPHTTTTTASVVASAQTCSSSISVESQTDVEFVESSQLYRQYRSLARSVSNIISNRASAFEGQPLPIGDPQTALLKLEGLPFHCNFPELKRLWASLKTIVTQQRVMFRTLESATRLIRRQREKWVRLFDRGIFDVVQAIDGGQQCHQVLADSAASTVTTHLQLARLSTFVATCRALDSSGAEVALKKLERRSSHFFEPTASVDMATTSTAMVSMGDFTSPDGADGHGTSIGSSAPSASVIPPTILTDLEMICRAYGLHVPQFHTPPAAETHMLHLNLHQGRVRPGGRGNRRASAMEAVQLSSAQALYAKSHRHAASATDTCATETDSIGVQTAIAGQVVEAHVHDSILSELAATRAQLHLKTQKLLLEQQRAATLLQQLETAHRAAKSLHGVVSASSPRNGPRSDAAQKEEDVCAAAVSGDPTTTVQAAAGDRQSPSPVASSPLPPLYGNQVPESEVDVLLLQDIMAEYEKRKRQQAGTGPLRPPSAKSWSSHPPHLRGSSSPTDAVASSDSSSFVIVRTLQRMQQHQPAAVTTTSAQQLNVGAKPSCAARHSSPPRSLDDEVGRLAAAELRKLRWSEASHRSHEHHDHRSNRNGCGSGESAAASVIVPIGVDPRWALGGKKKKADSVQQQRTQQSSFSNGLAAMHYGTVSTKN